jgi:hypothetical protein
MKQCPKSCKQHSEEGESFFHQDGAQFQHLPLITNYRILFIFEKIKSLHY